MNVKKKDIILLVAAAATFGLTAVLAFNLIVPKNTGVSKGVVVEVVVPIQPSFDEAGVKMISDTTKVRDFFLPVDLNSGIGNGSLFGPL